MPKGLTPTPRPGKKGRKPKDKKPSRIRRDCAASPQPQPTHCKNRHANRLEDRALLVLGPAANAAPDGRENAGKAGQAAEDAVEKAHARIRWCTATLDGLHRRAAAAANAVESQPPPHPA